MPCSGRVLIASKRVLSGAPIAHVLWFEPEYPTESGFLLLEADAPEDADADHLAPCCFDCALDLVPGNALDIARETGEWHAS
jgi:hypothetical protein